MTVIMKCSCHSEWQDKEYGPGMRVHNVQLKEGKHLKKARCTVCSVSRTSSMERDSDGVQTNAST